MYMHCVDLCFSFFFFYKGTNKIEILHLDSPLIQDKVINWDGKAFKKMKNLRILIIRKCHFSKAPNYLPNSLKVLEWWRYPSEELPSNFDLNQLERLYLSDMGFKSSKFTGLLQAIIMIFYVQDYSFDYFILSIHIF